MSELIDNRAERIRQLKTIIKDLHAPPLPSACSGKRAPGQGGAVTEPLGSVALTSEP